nr:MAG TPA: hypothetical protein [Caudoviricetes sp.]
MKIRKTKKRYKTRFRTQYCCTKVKFKKISTSIETEPLQYGVFVTYEVRTWYRKRELTTRYVRIKIAQQKSKHYMKIQNIMQKYKTK